MRKRTQHGLSWLTTISDAGSTPAASTIFIYPIPLLKATRLKPISIALLIVPILLTQHVPESSGNPFFETDRESSRASANPTLVAGATRWLSSWR